MNIVFMGGKQGGMIGLLTICAEFNRPTYVVAYDDIVSNLSKTLGIRPKESIKDVNLHFELMDLLISVHGREIVSNEILSRFKYGGINVHPMLTKYRGPNPVYRFIADNYRDKTDNMASVGCHRITDIIDGGEILSEIFINIERPWEKSIVEVYNELYQIYPLVLIKAIQRVCG